LIDRASNACVKAWCEANSADPAQVMRICTLYLTPDEQDDVRVLLGE
jgi:hypothetical protein